MAIGSTTPRIQYIATSGQKVFVIPFEWMENEDIKVYKEDVLLAASAYVLAGVGSPTGGTVTLNTGAAAGNHITIVRDIVIDRESDFPTTGPFNINALNRDLDKLYAITQELQSDVDRVVGLPDTDGAVDMELPSSAARKGRVLAFTDDTAAEPIAGPLISSVQAVEDGSADIDLCAANMPAIIAAPTHATNAANSATAANNSKNAAATSASNAAASASAAAASAVLADTEADRATVEADRAEAAADSVLATPNFAGDVTAHGYIAKFDTKAYLRLLNTSGGSGWQWQRESAGELTLIYTGDAFASEIAAVTVSIAGVWTFQKNPIIAPTSGAASLALQSTAGLAKTVDFRTGALARWNVGSSPAGESGANAGSNFVVNRYSDAGTLLGIALDINRADGSAKIWGNFTVYTDTAELRLQTTSGVGWRWRSVAAGASNGNMQLENTSNDWVAVGVPFAITPTGSVATFESASGSISFNIQGAASTSKNLFFRTGALARWVFQSNTSAESGANAGSNFVVVRYDDAGASLGSVFGIVRSTGLATFYQGLNVNAGGLTVVAGGMEVTAGGLDVPSGQTKHAAGTVSVPGLCFTNDTTTGWFRAGAGISAFTAAGTRVLDISVANGLRVTGGSSVQAWTIGAAGAATIANDKAGICVFDFNDPAGFVEIRTGGGTGALRVTAAGGIELARIGTTASAANAMLNGSSNSLLKSTSLRAVKDHITPLGPAFIAMAKKLRPVTYTSKLPADDPTQVHIGFIAEDMADDVPLLATYEAVIGPSPGEDPVTHDPLPGLPTGEKKLTGVAYERVAALLTALVQQHEREIEAMEARICALEAVT